MTTLWHRIAQIFDPSPVAQRIGSQLYDEYQARGYLARTCPEMLNLPDGAMAHFYARLAAGRSADSPVSAQPDSGWMARADFCFINVRATGSLDEQPGTFIQAAKLLPAIRASAIHLAPFTISDFGVVYAVRSARSIARELASPTLIAAGFPVETQVRALVQAAHLLGKAIGFDIEPHVTQFGIPVLMQPALFRWLKLYEPDKRWLDYLLTNDTMLREEHQRHIAAAVRGIVQAELQAAGLTDLELGEWDDAELIRCKQDIYSHILHLLIEQGYWTVPAQVWSGVGVPAFKYYNHESRFPEFRYQNRDGQEVVDGAYRIVTPFKFYTGLATNRVPDDPQWNAAAADYFAGIFGYWRDQFGFDFVRYDSVDHIFDSLRPDGGPQSDRPTPDVLRRCIEASRSAARPYTGSLAERMGNDIAEYAGLGFDLMLGTDMLERVNRAHIEKCFSLYDQLCDLNRWRAIPFGVTYAVDTHDTGSPHIWGVPLIALMGAERMRLRHFMARFIGCGCAPRPKYEVMGAQDLSYGLYEATISAKNLTWIGSDDYNRAYHLLEDVYTQYADFLRGARMMRRAVTEAYAWWALHNGPRWLIAVVSLEQEGETQPVETIEIDLLPGASVRVWTFDAQTSQPVAVTGAVLSIRDLPYLRFRLCEVNLPAQGVSA